MSATDHLASIVSDLAATVQCVREDEVAHLLDEIDAAGRVFVAGAGRSGTVVAAFANRLQHLGKPVSVVGEITAPHTRPGDLLIVHSGSGATATLVALAGVAKAQGVTVVLVTMHPESAIGRLADATVVLPDGAQACGAVAQPLATAFEQLSCLLYDAIVLELMARWGETEATMAARHANLE